MNERVLLLVTEPTVAESADAPGYREVDPDAAQLMVDDLGATRGDGFFETISVIDGHPGALEPHLRRFAHSASLLDFPQPNIPVWRDAVFAAIRARAARPGDPAPAEQALKLALTRGREGADVATGWMLLSPAGDMSGPRSTGIRVVTLDRGYRHDIAQTSPWLLQGAKTLSYALNRAALREAARRDADDVIFVSSDGFALEGPTANLLILADGRVSTPAVDQGILEGTTQASAFEFFAREGIPTSYERVAAADLASADGLWLVSSVRMAAPIRSLDGRALTIDHDLSDRLNAYLLARTE